MAYWSKIENKHKTINIKSHKLRLAVLTRDQVEAQNIQNVGHWATYEWGVYGCGGLW